MTQYFYYGSTTVAFNVPNDANSAWLVSISPLSRAPITVEHQIDGREYSRVYQRGANAGTVSISGYYQLSSTFPTSLNAMMATNAPFRFTSDNVELLYCMFDGAISYTPVPGTTYMKFSFRLIEAH